MGSKKAFGGSSLMYSFLASFGIKAALMNPTLHGVLSLQDVNEQLFY